MDVRTATNEQTLTWIVGLTERDATNALSEISALATEHSALLFRVAFSVLRNASDAEDVVQETFLRVLKHQRKLATIEDPRVWLIRIAWNLALDRKRRLRATPMVEEAEEILRNHASEEATAEVTLGAAEGCVRILHMMDKLPRCDYPLWKKNVYEEMTGRLSAAL